MEIENFKYVSKYDVNVSESGEVIRRCTPQPDKAGYKRIQVKVNGKIMTTGIHRLVAMAYIPNPLNKPDVNHIDGNKGNNHVSNLEWVTESENTQHALKHLENKPGRKAWQNERDTSILENFKMGFTRDMLCRKFNMKRPNISRILRDKQFLVNGTRS